MLHEVLLSLSGHPSPLFDSNGKPGVVADGFPLTTPSERALLASLGDLSRLHRNLRSHTTRISSSHPSTICRAVASSIRSTHLTRFQQKIVEVEAKILKKDTGSVAAYDVVPLAGIVGEFDEWRRRMEWYWDLACFIQPASQSGRSPRVSKCTGASTINRLRKEVQTGYPDIEQAALELGRVAETAWLRQLTSWVLYGRLPTFGSEDFFVRHEEFPQGGDLEVSIDSELLPKFVTHRTASSIVFIGRILNQIRSRGLAGSSSLNDHIPSDIELLHEHLRHLSALDFPLTAVSFAAAIAAIRSSLSRKTLQRLLPLPKIVQLLDLLEDFFLLRRGEFATTLITEADDRFDSRSRSTTSKQPSQTTSKAGSGVRNLAFKEPELAAVLNRTFATLTSLAPDSDDDDGTADSTLDLARSLVKLAIGTPKKELTTDFRDVLLPTPTELTLSLPSPLDLFLSPKDLSLYSQAHSYLLSIRRAHMHLTALWRLTSFRRIHPAPAGPSASTSHRGRELLEQRRRRYNRREAGMRKVWATCGKAVFFLSELTGFLEGVVIRSACEHLFASLADESDKRPGSSSGGYSHHSTVAGGIASLKSSFRSSGMHEQPALHPRSTVGDDIYSRPGTAHNERKTEHDPTALASLHAAFLSSLMQALLLTRTNFTSQLRQLFTSVDVLVGQISRLQSIQSNLDLEEDEGVVDALNDWRKDENNCLIEVDRGRKKVDEGLRACLDTLSEVDAEGSRGALLGVISKTSEVPTELVTDPKWNWRPPALDRLLMKLEYGKMEGVQVDDDDDRL